MQKIKNIFTVADLRNKILFTVVIIGVYRLGSFITLPGVRADAVQALTSTSKGNNGVLGFLSLFSGGALNRMALFGLGITPYITASIIIQLMQVVIPKLAEWKDQGAIGQKKITQTTRYLTVVLSLMQATGFAFAMHDPNARQSFGISTSVPPIFNNFDSNTIILFVGTMVVGTIVVMWLGELITQRGIGQGMSIIIFANIVSRMPSEGQAIYEEKRSAWPVLALFVFALIVAVIIIEQGQRRIPVQFAKRVVGRRMTAGQSTYIPMKVNPSGVIPIIFATSVLQFPALLATVVPYKWFRNFVNTHLFQGQSNLSYSMALIFGLLIVGFAYFYNHIQFDPYEQADQLKKQGAYVPGVRPGTETQKHIAYVLNRITLPGSLFLAFVALLPTIVLAIYGVNNFPFAGTTLLIAVGVGLDTMKQIDSQLMMRNYEGFLKQ